MTPRLKKWPFEGDAPVGRARKIALAYRASAKTAQRQLDTLRDLLNVIDPDNPAANLIAAALKDSPDMQTVEQLDQRFTDWGETWHCPRPVHYDDDDYVDVKIAGELIQLQPATIHRLRVVGRITGIWNDSIGQRGGWVFRVGDLYKLSAERRPRGYNLKGRGGKSTRG